MLLLTVAEPELEMPPPYSELFPEKVLLVTVSVA
jgi:hypothetical protein